MDAGDQLATLLETRVGGIYVRKDYVPNSGDYVTPGHIDIATGISSVNGATRRAALDNQITLDASLATRGRDWGDARLQVRRPDDAVEQFDGRAGASSDLCYTISAPRRTAPTQEP